jgi:hypothetical protein
MIIKMMHRLTFLYRFRTCLNVITLCTHVITTLYVYQFMNRKWKNNIIENFSTNSKRKVNFLNDEGKFHTSCQYGRPVGTFQLHESSILWTYWIRVFKNSRFQFHDFTISLHEFTILTSWIHDFKFTNYVSRIHVLNFKISTSRIQAFNFTLSTSWIQLHEFMFWFQLHEFKI